MTELIHIKNSDLKSFKEEQHNKQKSKCPILKKEFPIEKMVVDHKHGRKDTPLGYNGSGLIRGVIENGVNRLEGKIQGCYTRFGLEKHISLPELLRNLADYLETPPLGKKYIHPSEIKAVKAPKLFKRDYNLVLFFWQQISPKARTIPEYPKSGLMTGKWPEWVAKAKELKQ